MVVAAGGGGWARGAAKGLATGHELDIGDPLLLCGLSNGFALLFEIGIEG